MTKRLYRNRKDKIIAGVLGGMASYYGHDPVFWRLGFIVLLFLTGLFPFVLIYVVAWILIPLEPEIAAMDKENYTVHSDESQGA